MRKYLDTFRHRGEVGPPAHPKGHGRGGMDSVDSNASVRKGEIMKVSQRQYLDSESSDCLKSSFDLSANGEFFSATLGTVSLHAL